MVVAEIDIDSDRPAAFGDGDREFLERVAELLRPTAWWAGTPAASPGSPRQPSGRSTQAASRTSAGAFSQ